MPGEMATAGRTSSNTSCAGVGLPLGIALTGSVYAYVAHLQGLTLASIEEPWRTLSVVSGAFLFSGFSGMGLISLSTPNPLQSFRHLRLLFNMSIPLYLLMITVTLVAKTPKEILDRPAGRNPDNPPLPVVTGLLIWTAGFLALFVGNITFSAIIEQVEDAEERKPVSGNKDEHKTQESDGKQK